MDKQTAINLIKSFEFVFDIVRLVDVSLTYQCEIDDEGNITKTPYECYAVWKKNGRCENCISSKAFTKQCQLTKYEFVDNEVYYVTSKYVVIEDEPYVLEMVSKVTDETLFDAYGKNNFVETITDLNHKMYVDPLTGAYNRRYFDEQLRGLMSDKNVFALVDLDNFKEVNDTYGHAAGDKVLISVANILMAKTRASDAVIRYGGDEFFVVYANMPYVKFTERLENIRREVSKLAFDDCPGLKVSVSIGGAARTTDTDPFELADSALYEAKKSKDAVKLAE